MQIKISSNKRVFSDNPIPDEVKKCDAVNSNDKSNISDYRREMQHGMLQMTVEHQLETRPFIRTIILLSGNEEAHFEMKTI